MTNELNGIAHDSHTLRNIKIQCHFAIVNLSNQDMKQGESITDFIAVFVVKKLINHFKLDSRDKLKLARAMTCD